MAGSQVLCYGASAGPQVLRCEAMQQHTPPRSWLMSLSAARCAAGATAGASVGTARAAPGVPPGHVAAEHTPGRARIHRPACVSTIQYARGHAARQQAHRCGRGGATRGVRARQDCARCDCACAKDVRHMYARLSTVSTSFSPQPPVGSRCRNRTISCAARTRLRVPQPINPIQAF